MSSRMSAARRAQASPRPHQSRRGTIMLETVFVVSVSTVLMGMAALTIHHLLATHANSRDATRNSLMRQRLIAQFRTDCREADSAVLQDGVCTFTGSQHGDITWEVQGPDDNVVVRTWSHSGRTGRDRFYSTRDWSARLEVQDDTARILLTQTPGGSQRTLPGKVRRVTAEAHVGTNNRLQQRLSNSPESSAGGRQ